jgi:hypothetical protein
MRRVFAVGLAVVATTAMLAVPALAQAPAAPPTPKVTITGFIDTVASYTKNLSVVDLNYDKTGDDEVYARNRLRPDIMAEVGTTKFVLGLEVDYAWGQTGAGDVAGPNRSGASGGADLNTDLGAAGNAIIELKWGYVEFDMPGIPWGTRVRLGAQPWAATYKLATLANGDFAGAHVTATLAPPVKLNFTYGQVEEESTGSRDGFLRGEDFAIITSVEITPFKGLDIRPIYSFFRSEGTTAGASRQGRGGVSNADAFFPLDASESRHTIGVDARWRSGPFSLDPTVFFQFGDREVSPFGGGGGVVEQDRRAWFFDIRGGFQAGPLLLELAGIYTTGNKAQHDIRNGRTDVKFYEPISTDTSFYGAWAEHWALGIDYFNIIYSGAAGLNPGVAIGYDKYGLIRIGSRVSYAVTPAFTLRAAATANWTDEKVDTDGAIAAATGITPAAGAARSGDSRYLGTEVDLGFQWRFAPGVAFDVVGAYTFTGPAMAAAVSTPTSGGARDANNVENITTATARIRFSF